MKKIYLFAAALVLSAGINAQLSNGGFENWQNNDPVDWESLDAFIPSLIANGITVQMGGVDVTETVVESTDDPIEGNSSAKISSFTISGSPIPDLPNGVYGNYIEQVVTTNQKHGGVAFAYKSNIQGNDAVGVFIQALKNGALVAQSYSVITDNESSWVRDTLYLNYSDTPDEIEILFISSFGTVISGTSAPNVGVDGTTFEVDDVQLLPEPSFADPVTNIVASDVADNGDGRDLQVSFTAAADENTVSEYRIIVIESGLSLVDWSVVPAGLYTSVTPDGSASYELTLADDAFYLAASGGTSVAPELIVENVEMDVYVLSIADGTIAEVNQIAGPSNSITLTSEGSSSIAINEKDVKVFPNPANDFVTFQIDGLENGNVVISSITGQEVVNTSLNGVTKVDVSALNNGVYIYKITNSNGELVKTSKLVIQK